MEEKGFENADIVFITDGECVPITRFISVAGRTSETSLYDYGYPTGSRKRRHGFQLKGLLPKHLPQ